ncbi:lactonase family protein [Hydrogenophaga sp. T2]|uniref:lactonase family protein n=1 Tax=Hydrogenophaga sp. T2 TaxID=3132823 RepID=UPI003CF3952C
MRAPAAPLFRPLRHALSFLALGSSLLLAACGSGGSTPDAGSAGNSAPPAPTFSVAGRVSGLTGAGLMLSLNGGAPLALSADGGFSFPTEVNARYAVTVAAQPAGQTCTVSNATGASRDTDVAQVRVNCSATTHTVGGSVSGLAGGRSLVLRNNGADPITVSANGAYAFATRVARNGGYAVSVDTQPTGQTCTVSNATGDGVLANVGNVNVLCAASSHGVGGSVAGLAAGATVTLLNNGSDATVVAANGPYAFATRVADQGGYAVTVGTQPAGQTCTVANAQGSGLAADVGNVNVQCSATVHTIGGTLSGLLANQQVTLYNNGADPLTLTANGAFQFATPIAAQTGYAVTQGAASRGVGCTVGNGSGSNATADVGNVAVACTTTALSFVYVTDYNNDRILGYSMDRLTGARTALPGSPYAAGDNNRWLTLHPNQAFFYSANLGSSNVSAYTVNASTGALTPVAGSPFASGSQPTSIQVTPDGRFAYTANSQGGNVSGFRIDQTTGALTPLPGSPYAAGNIPTKIAITPNSRFLYVTNQNGQNLSAYRIDATTGALTEVAGSPYPLAGQPYGIGVHPSGNFVYPVVYQAKLHALRIDPTTGELTDLQPGGYGSSGSDWEWLSFTTNGAGTVGYVATNQGIRAFDIDTTTGALTARAGFAHAGRYEYLTTNPEGDHLYAADFHAIYTHMLDIDPANGNLTPFSGSAVPVDARPYNLVVIER